MEQEDRETRVNRGEFLKITALAVASMFVKACSRLGLNIPTNVVEDTSVEVIPSPKAEEQTQTALIQEEILKEAPTETPEDQISSKPFFPSSQPAFPEG